MLLRRLLSILLLLLTGLPAAAPLFALGGDADAGLPACCRRHGQHHCAMNVQATHLLEAAQDQALPQWRSAMQCCRMYGAATVSFHPETMRPATSSGIFAGLWSHTSIHPQVDSQYRLARDRARQKRGPPSILS